MKKKARAKAKASAPKAAKGRKTGAKGRKTARLRAQNGSRRSVARKEEGPDEARSAVRRLRQELAEARAEIEQLKAAAETDFLLDILNRRGFERELSRSIAFIKRYSARAALLVLDVDRLKPINDAFGHAAGDQVLKTIVQMPAGIPVGTLAIGKAGAINAALLAASVLALNDPPLAARLAAWRKKQTDSVAERPEGSA
jgi:predicted signal transduction protein with EAL and GGDEF domain